VALGIALSVQLGISWLLSTNQYVKLFLYLPSGKKIRYALEGALALLVV